MSLVPPVKVVIVGLGGRGKDTYASYASKLTDKMKIVAIADPIAEKRQEVAQANGIPDGMCFETAEELFRQDKLADAVFICTQDKMHFAHACAALRKGYHLLLEKPVSPIKAECDEIARLAGKYNLRVVVCHVLRYTPFFQEIKRIIDSGILGRVVTVQALENVQYWHQAHSYVRGNWSREETSSPMILAKCCHDMDILLWLTGKKSKYVSSFGSLYHFRPENAPEGAATRCIDCTVDCPYNAERIYITDKETGVAMGNTGWPVNIVVHHPTVENVREALKEGPYGVCVYHGDNNVVDHQVVNIELEDSTTINFTMSAFTSTMGRSLKVMGTLGDLTAQMEDNKIEVGIFGNTHEIIDVNELATNFEGHGGGDIRMLEDFMDVLICEGRENKRLTTVERSLESHYVAMAAEYSRLHHGQSISMDEFDRFM